MKLKQPNEQATEHLRVRLSKLNLSDKIIVNVWPRGQIEIRVFLGPGNPDHTHRALPPKQALSFIDGVIDGLKMGGVIAR